MAYLAKAFSFLLAEVGFSKSFDLDLAIVGLGKGYNVLAKVGSLMCQIDNQLCMHRICRMVLEGPLENWWLATYLKGPYQPSFHTFFFRERENYFDFFSSPLGYPRAFEPNFNDVSASLIQRSC